MTESITTSGDYTSPRPIYTGPSSSPPIEAGPKLNPPTSGAE